jgi:hypothetical protein
MKNKLLGNKRERKINSLIVQGIRDENKFIYYSSIIELPAKTMMRFDVKEDDYVILKNNKRKILAKILEDFSEEINDDYVRLNSVMRKNLKVQIGNHIELTKCTNISEIDEIELKPIKNQNRGYIYSLKNYFQHLKKAVYVGNIIYIKYNDKSIPFKIMKINPSTYGFISCKTKFNVGKKNKIIEDKKHLLEGFPKENLYIPLFAILIQVIIFLLFKRNIISNAHFQFNKVL